MADTGISVTFEARDAIRRFAAVATGAVSQRVTIPDALRLAVYVATRHPDELEASAAVLGIIPPTESIGETQ